MADFQKVYVDKTVEIPLYYRKNVELVSPRLGNFFANPHPGRLRPGTSWTGSASKPSGSDLTGRIERGARLAGAPLLPRGVPAAMRATRPRCTVRATHRPLGRSMQ